VKIDSSRNKERNRIKTFIAHQSCMQQQRKKERKKNPPDLFGRE
jgi:hypothetical protein